MGKFLNRSEGKGEVKPESGMINWIFMNSVENCSKGGGDRDWTSPWSCLGPERGEKPRSAEGGILGSSHAQEVRCPQSVDISINRDKRGTTDIHGSTGGVPIPGKPPTLGKTTKPTQ